MAESSHNLWSQHIDQCTSSPEKFQVLAPKLLAVLPKADSSFWDALFTRLSLIITSQQFSSVQRFYGLYLLFKVAEKRNLNFASRMVEQHDLLAFIVHSAQHEATKKISFDERGKFFFSNNASIVGINFVRLCLECMINLQRIYGRQGTNHPYSIFTSYIENLRTKMKIPQYFVFIGNNFDLSQDLARWNYLEHPPKKVGEILNGLLKKKVNFLKAITAGNKPKQQPNLFNLKPASNPASDPAQDPKTHKKTNVNTEVPKPQIVEKASPAEPISSQSKKPDAPSPLPIRSDLNLDKKKESIKEPSPAEIVITESEGIMDDLMVPTSKEIIIEDIDPYFAKPSSKTPEPFPAYDDYEANYLKLCTPGKGSVRPKNYKDRLASDLMEIQRSINKSRDMQNLSPIQPIQGHLTEPNRHLTPEKPTISYLKSSSLAVVRPDLNKNYDFNLESAPRFSQTTATTKHKYQGSRLSLGTTIRFTPNSFSISTPRKPENIGANFQEPAAQDHVSGPAQRIPTPRKSTRNKTAVPIACMNTPDRQKSPIEWIDETRREKPQTNNNSKVINEKVNIKELKLQQPLMTPPDFCGRRHPASVSGPPRKLVRFGLLQNGDC